MNNDTNECLIRSLKEEMEKEEFLSSYDGKDKVISSYDMNEELKKSGALEVKGYNCGFPYLSSKIGKLEPGNIITVTGYSGQGKTTILISMTIKLAEQGIPVLWFSYENTPAQFFRKFQNVDLPLFYLPMSNKPYDLSWFTDRVKEAILKYDIKVIMIDHLHYILDLFQSKNSSIDIGNLLRNLKILAVENELVIFLVAHTKQPKDFNDPDMGSIRDSSFIVQESDKVLAVHRSKGSGRSKVIVLKDRDFGSSMGQYSEFFLNGNLLEEVETYKQGEVCKAASESRKEGERLRDLEAVKEIK